ncbi:MAG: hypothetical protein HY847_02375 [Betaproteobacteria bacterium]|nr:hypothetical protein [Betaproteobacteria bacterium]
MDRELYSHVDVLENDLKSADKSRAHLSNRLSEMSGLFGNNYTMLDVALAPLLWRHSQ